MSGNLEFRPYRSGDESKILQLFFESYGHDLGERFWSWRFRDNPAGPGVIDLCWDGDVLAAHYAVTTVASRLNEQDWFTGLSGTTMTHPHYRGRGLFPILARNTYARMAENGMAMVWGFPNAMSHRGFVKDLGWGDIYEVPTFRLSLTGRLTFPILDDALVELQEFDSRFDLLWERVKDDYPVVTRRDSHHLQWRYILNPSERYRVLGYVDKDHVLGYAVFKRFRDELQVVDILTIQDMRVGAQLISGIARVASEVSATAISLWLNVTHPLHHALERFGFQNGEPVTYLGALALRPELSKLDLTDYRGWYLTMGDSDVF
jgi:hypothetical protein